MKKQILKLTMVLVLPLMLINQSCKKESEDTKSTNVTMGSATITGRITGDIILNNGLKEGIAGIKITGRINTADLITTGSVATAGLTRTYEATTDANGNYTLTVDVNSKPVVVTLDIYPSLMCEFPLL
jgi:phosphatidate phosphatase APP1